ncbi:hypothetical protein WJX74_010524 [Apatococcus lobatus]|uniref:Cytochrome P450 n=1 Tax=Apatococcus lobatus TaxID=904363 RepID=A0AAW1QDL4_9CHLO
MFGLLLGLVCWVFRVVSQATGPAPWPILGNLAEIKWKGECFALADWKAQYGNIFVVWLGPTPMWVVSDPDVSRAMLSRNVDKPPYVSESKSYSESILAFANGPHYRKLKLHWTPLFLQGSLQHYITLMEGGAKNLVASLQPQAGSAAIDIIPFFDAHVLEVAISAAFGVELHTQTGDPLMKPDAYDQKLVAAVCGRSGTAGVSSQWATPMMLFPALRPLFHFLSSRFPDPAAAKRFESMQRLNGFIQDLIHGEHAAIAQRSSADLGMAKRKGVLPGSFLSLLVAQSQGGERLTEAEIVAQAFFFIVAGFSTSVDAMPCLMYNLAGHPDKLKTAHAEVDAAGPDFVPTLDNLEGFPYLTACLRESLRLFPPISATKRYAREGGALGPFHVAVGDMLCGATYTLHRDAELWDNPTSFVPERFLDTKDGNKPDIRKGTLNTFGEGMRSCIGQKFAKMEIKITLIRLLQAYTRWPPVKPPSPSPHSPSPRCSSLTRASTSPFTAEHEVNNPRRIRDQKYCRGHFTRAHEAAVE